MLRLNDEARRALKHRKGFEIALYNVPTEDEELRLMAGVTVYLQFGKEKKEMTINPGVFLDVILNEAIDEFG